ncbi:hypothetical protein HBHAL_2589 [Halobacillus halophilus DSM 2266]|uniref:Uncharacterized protein n=1 Tax=Halobacillus halophilus (strain ATCC 35676 / DSM 2266 / JCM 20832 / KCTC 3685 / LMG 17431 / NBRC 102448 / NCIMB 2269) TaxID=866895 RepID=I0JLB5_HALH3|nr:hypothetical protein [Halobacillus halophilus]CCG44935.1 hypothetical protein HBHAL_2589 [Halobacillus halophilus DSM 2266]
MNNQQELETYIKNVDQSLEKFRENLKVIHKHEEDKYNEAEDP